MVLFLLLQGLLVAVLILGGLSPEALVVLVTSVWIVWNLLQLVQLVLMRTRVMMVIKQNRESLSSEKGKGGVIDSNVDCTIFYLVE